MENNKFRLKNIFNIQHVLIPIFLCVVFMPMLVAFFWYVLFYHGGSILDTYNEICPGISKQLSIGSIYDITACNGYSRFIDIFLELPTDIQIWKYLWCYIVFQLLLYKGVPASKLYYGPRYPLGNDIYIHYDNGFNGYLINMILLCSVSWVYPEYLTFIYEKFGYFLATSSANTCLTWGFFTLVNYYKHLMKKSDLKWSYNNNANENIVDDFFYGIEIYPLVTVFGMEVNIKYFITSRYFMMIWQLLVFVNISEQYHQLGYIASSMMVVSILQTVYICCYFYNEADSCIGSVSKTALSRKAYMNKNLDSVSICYDYHHVPYVCAVNEHSVNTRTDECFGYVKCWKMTVFLPMLYTYNAHYLVTHPILLSTWYCGTLLGLGLVCIGLCNNYRHWHINMNHSCHRYMCNSCDWWCVHYAHRLIPMVCESCFAIICCMPCGYDHQISYLYAVFSLIQLGRYLLNE